MTMPSTSGCLASADTRLASVSRLSLVRLSEATWNTCSPRTLATLASSGRPAISLSTPHLGGRVGGAVDGRGAGAGDGAAGGQDHDVGQADWACATARGGQQRGARPRRRGNGKRRYMETPWEWWCEGGAKIPEACPSGAGARCRACMRSCRRSRHGDAARSGQALPSPGGLPPKQMTSEILSSEPPAAQQMPAPDGPLSRARPGRERIMAAIRARRSPNSACTASRAPRRRRSPRAPA